MVSTNRDHTKKGSIPKSRKCDFDKMTLTAIWNKTDDTCYNIEDITWVVIQYGIYKTSFLYLIQTSLAEF